ncbi:MAG: hypothetical protein PHG05_02940 [Candidatus Nanoarchaeia archaeon]|nr:hypothetical protein [Candidatus Nanoarchaeia archaeon]
MTDEYKDKLLVSLASVVLSSSSYSKIDKILDYNKLFEGTGEDLLSEIIVDKRDILNISPDKLELIDQLRRWIWEDQNLGYCCKLFLSVSSSNLPDKAFFLEDKLSSLDLGRYIYKSSLETGGGLIEIPTLKIDATLELGM